MNLKKKKTLTLLIVLILSLGLAACGAPAPEAPEDPYAAISGTTLTIATTTSTNDTGLMDYLVPMFDEKYGTETKWVSVGSGEAMEMGKRGDADLLLVHSRAAEDEFMAEGYGVSRKDVMYNFFYIIGPTSDPAAVKGTELAKDGMKKIYDAKAPFVSRADSSGTHTRELNLWKAAEVTPDAKTDKWYNEAGAGMGDVLTMCNEMNAYTISDSGTWGGLKDQLTNLEIVLEGDTALYNPYGVIVVSQEKFPNLNTEAAQAFSDFLVSEEGQKAIGEYEKNGQTLFVPDAK